MRYVRRLADWQVPRWVTAIRLRAAPAHLPSEAVSARAKADLAAARSLPALRERLGRYLNSDYNAQLAGIYQLAQEAEGSGATTREIRVIAASALETGLDLVTIASEAELERWLAALREAALAELKKGNRISL